MDTETVEDKEEKLEFETPQFLHGLFANEPRELKYIEEVLEVSVVTREGWMLFKGDASNVSLAKQAILDLEEARRSGHEIGVKEFRMAIDIAKRGEESGLSEMTKVKLLGAKGKKPIVARTPQQLTYLEAMQKNDVVFGLGPAGTGKTYLAMAMALHMLQEKKISRIILTRPAVEAGEALGFLPGDMQEKVAPYLRPLYDAMHDMLDPDQAKRYMEDGTIEVAPLAYMRGRTLSKSFVILDEAQNTTPEQMFMLLTRIGEQSYCAVTGDGSQVDLRNKKGLHGKGVTSGLAEAEQALKHIKGIDFVRFSGEDVVRHPVVARIIKAYDKHRQVESI